MPKTHTAYCRNCGYDGPGWTYVGPQTDDNGSTIVFHWWTCPKCHGSHASYSADNPPQR